MPGVRRKPCGEEFLSNRGVDPEREGVLGLDDQIRAVSMEEKAGRAKSHWVVSGLYVSAGFTYMTPKRRISPPIRDAPTVFRIGPVSRKSPTTLGMRLGESGDEK